MSSVEIKKDAGGANWQVDWKFVNHIIKSFCFEVSFSNNSHPVYLPKGLLLPRQKIIKTDWRAAKAEERQLYNMYERSFELNPPRVEHLKSMLNGMVSIIAKQRTKRLADQRLVMRENMAAIKRTTENLETTVVILKAIRNTATTTLLVGSSVFSGPTALAIAAGGSGLSGVGKYQDTGSVAAGVLNGSAAFITASFPIGKKTLGSASERFGTQEAIEKVVIVQLEVFFKTSTEFVQGVPLVEALRRGTIKALTGNLPGLLGKHPAFKEFLVPAANNIAAGAKGIPSKVLTKMAMNLVANKLISAGQNTAVAKVSYKRKTAAEIASHSVIEHLDKLTLFYRKAIIRLPSKK